MLASTLWRHVTPLNHVYCILHSDVVALMHTRLVLQPVRRVAARDESSPASPAQARSTSLQHQTAALAHHVALAACFSPMVAVRMALASCLGHSNWKGCRGTWSEQVSQAFSEGPARVFNRQP